MKNKQTKVTNFVIGLLLGIGYILILFLVALYYNSLEMWNGMMFASILSLYGTVFIIVINHEIKRYKSKRDSEEPELEFMAYQTNESEESENEQINFINFLSNKCKENLLGLKHHTFFIEHNSPKNLTDEQIHECICIVGREYPLAFNYSVSRTSALGTMIIRFSTNYHQYKAFLRFLDEGRDN